MTDTEPSEEYLRLQAQWSREFQENQRLLEIEKASPATSVQSPVQGSPRQFLSLGEREEIDSRSIFVGNLPPSTTEEEIKDHFSSCGTIERVTLPTVKHTGKPKGYAYIEFQSKSNAEAALMLENSQFSGRLLKVTSKRTNLPHFSRGRGRGRGRFQRRPFRGGPRL
ncbi:hypothetical protein RCL1_003691 [Eukaryota sp. TZLM3-RCL]